MVQLQHDLPFLTGVRYTSDDLTGSLLCCACYSGHLSIAKYLIEECKCDASGVVSKYIIPIKSAVAGNYLNIVKYLANTPHFIIREQISSLVHYAAQMSDVKMVEYLTQKLHCDFNCKRNSSNTCLHIACCHGDPDIVDYFLTTLKCDP